MTKSGTVKSDLASYTAPTMEETKIDLGKLQETEKITVIGESDIVLKNLGSSTSSANGDSKVIGNPGTSDVSNLADTSNLGTQSSKATSDTKDDEGIKSDPETIVNPVAAACDTHVKSSVPLTDSSIEDPGKAKDPDSEVEGTGTGFAEEDDDTVDKDNECTRL